MAGTRKRKHATADYDATQRAQPDMKAFGVVCKVWDESVGPKKRKTLHQRDTTLVQPKATAQHPTPQSINKRKRHHGPEGDEEPLHDTQQSTIEHFASTNDGTIAHNKRLKSVQPPTAADTPSKDTVALFDRLRLDPDAKAIPFPVNKARLPNTPPRTPESEEDSCRSLPVELQDLVQLHAAFLSALSMYYAHNGTSSTVNVKSLLLMITKNWKKRAVALDDLRKILAIEQEHAAFVLQDFGRAGICLSKAVTRGRSSKRAVNFVDEVALSERFEVGLRAAWAKWTACAVDVGSNPFSFTSQLTLLDIAQDESVEKAAPMYARGHQRLAELKAGQAAAQREPTPTSEQEICRKPSHAPQSRGSSLLDRVLAKQAHTASLPVGPTKQQLERRAALHRIEDIARVLDLLAAGRARCSFSMQAMVQQLQQSLRNPISREEVERCLGLMAEEITPGFVSLLKNGTVTGVVVTRGGKIGLGDLRSRVANAVA